jgi:hypothetical protein
MSIFKKIHSGEVNFHTGYKCVHFSRNKSNGAYFNMTLSSTEKKEEMGHNFCTQSSVVLLENWEEYVTLRGNCKSQTPQFWLDSRLRLFLGNALLLVSWTWNTKSSSVVKGYC